MAEHRLDLDNIQSNSDTTRKTNYARPTESQKPNETPSEEKTPVEKVVTGKVVKKNKAKVFGADILEIGKGLTNEVVKPRLKDFVYDFIDTGMSRLLWNDSPRSRIGYRPGYTGGGHTAYSSAYSGRPNSATSQTVNKTISRQEREAFKFSEFEFAERVDAERVMDMLQAQVDQEGSVSVADYYGLIGVDTEYQDHKWGWTDAGELRDMKIRPSHRTYVIIMPQPIPLNVTGMNR